MKKIISLLLSIGIVVSAVPAWAEEKESNLLAFEDFSDTCYSDNLITLGDEGGIGWDGGFRSNLKPAAPIVSFTSDGGVKDSRYILNAVNGIMTVRTDNSTYRYLEAPIKYNEPGEYIFSWNLYLSSSSNTSFDSEMWIGKSMFAGIAPGGKTKVGTGSITSPEKGADTISTTEAFTGQKSYRVIAKLSIGENGEAALSAQTVLSDDNIMLNDTWDINTNVSLAEDIDIIRLFNLGWGNTAYYDDITVEKYALKDSEIFDDALAKVTAGTLTEAEAKTAIGAVSKYDLTFTDNGSVKDIFYINEVYKKIKTYAVNKGYDLSPSVISQSIEDGATVRAQLVKKADVAYELGLTEQGVVLEEDGSAVASDTAIDKNMLTTEFTLKPNKSYKLKLNGVKDFSGASVTDKEISFTTDLIPYINLEDIKVNGEYVVGQYGYIDWTDYEGANITASIQYSDEIAPTEIQNHYEMVKAGECILTLNVEANGKNQQEQYNIAVTPAYSPTVSDIQINVKDDLCVETGAILTVSYVFTDLNGDTENKDTENGTAFQWYRCKASDGEYEAIPGATGREYQLTEADEDMYIKVAVTPVSISNAEATGDTVCIDTAFTGAFRPVAGDVKISGVMRHGEKLKASYSYTDNNDDDEQDMPVIEWYSVKETNETKIGEGEELLIDDQCDDKDIYVKITPVSKKKPESGVTVSSAKISGTYKPYADNVYISGTAKVGGSITGYYTYHDINEGDEEGVGTVTGWFEGTVKIADGDSLKLTSDYQGKTLRFGVKPFSINAPVEGEWVYSDTVVISKQTSSGGGGGSSGGSGGGYMIPNYSPTAQDKNEENNEVKPDVKPEQKFTDITSHWAKDYITDLYEAEIVNGISENLYAPDKKVTRAELLAMIFRVKKDYSSDMNSIFEDVADNAWYKEYVAMGVNSGAIAKDKYFRPNDSVTREECAKIISFIFDLKATGNIPDFADKEQISEWAHEYVSAVYENDIMTGNTDFCFNPKDGLTRGECAKILWCLMKK